MAESMRAPSLSPAPRRPAGRRVKLPHPHLAPKPRQEAEPARPEPEISSRDARTFLAPPPAAAPAAELHEPDDWTASLIPDPIRLASAAGSPRSPSPTRAEKTLRAALWLGLCLNGAALLLWDYSGGDFLLAAAALVSGQALLVLGARCRQTDGRADRQTD